MFNDSISHYTLLTKLHRYGNDRIIIRYVWLFLNRCVGWGGLYHDIQRGIPKGSSLSPFLGAFYLLDLDREIEKLDVKYFLYMEDILILASTRWKLRKAIRVLNLTFNELGLEKHPNKILIGAIERGFDFLGYHFHHRLAGCRAETLSSYFYFSRNLAIREVSASYDRPL